MKSLSKNMLMSIITRVITLITGLIVQQQILIKYGSSLNGLTSSIAQVMSYLVILEAGLGTASIQALYQPLSTNDWKKISGIFTATGTEYKKISFGFMALLVLSSILLPLMLLDQIDFFLASLLTLITGASYIISYILGGKYKVLLTADRKLYILNFLECVSVIISCVLRVVALKLGYGIVLVQFLNLLCVLIKNIGYFIYVKKKYKNVNYFEKPDFHAVSKRWNVLIHSLSGIVVNHTDIMILTFFSSLKIVSVYSIYNMVFSQLSTLIQSTFLTTPQANFGRLFNSNFTKFKEIFKSFEHFFIILLFMISTIAWIMITPFIEVYTKGVNDINYINVYLPILFCLILIMNQIRIPALMLINISGDFKETQKGAIIEAVINLVVSVILFFFTPLGIYGLLIGTVISYIYRSIDVIRYSYVNVIKENFRGLIKKIFINTTVMILLYLNFHCLFKLHALSVIDWIIKAIYISIITMFSFIVVNFIFNKNEILNIVHILKGRIKAHVK